MKTNHDNQPTPSAVPQADTDNNAKARKYRVHLYWMQANEAFLTLTANSLAEAEEMAEVIQADDLCDRVLDPIKGELLIDSVTPVDEGQSHE